jgi:electron transport complex protein RnfG
MSEAVQNIIPQEKEPSSFRLIATLGVAGFLSGLVLVSIYLFTKPIIAQNKADALKAAIFEVLPGTDSYITLMADGNSLREADDTEAQDAEVIYMGKDGDGNPTGFAVPGAEAGYQDIIAALCGYDAGGDVIIGLKVLESKETPGLGDKIFKDADFQLNFTALQVLPEIESVKKGEKQRENQVEAITGATISSNAIVRLLNDSMEKWREPIANYMQRENPKTAENE